jgi:hypothetical protein
VVVAAVVATAAAIDPLRVKSHVKPSASDKRHLRVPFCCLHAAQVAIAHQ